MCRSDGFLHFLVYSSVLPCIYLQFLSNKCYWIEIIQSTYSLKYVFQNTGNLTRVRPSIGSGGSFCHSRKLERWHIGLKILLKMRHGYLGLLWDFLLPFFSQLWWTNSCFFFRGSKRAVNKIISQTLKLLVSDCFNQEK